jgi:hypothetical protein
MLESKDMVGSGHDKIRGLVPTWTKTKNIMKSTIFWDIKPCSPLEVY